PFSYPAQGPCHRESMLRSRSQQNRARPPPNACDLWRSLGGLRPLGGKNRSTGSAARDLECATRLYKLGENPTAVPLSAQPCAGLARHHGNTCSQKYFGSSPQARTDSEPLGICPPRYRLGAALRRSRGTQPSLAQGLSLGYCG